MTPLKGGPNVADATDMTFTIGDPETMKETYAVVYSHDGGAVLAHVGGYTFDEARTLAQSRADAEGRPVVLDFGFDDSRVAFFTVNPTTKGN